MFRVKSVKIDGESIHAFNSAIYILESTGSGYTLQLDLIVSEIVLRKYKAEENLFIEFELNDGRVITAMMTPRSVPGGLPQLNFSCDVDDPNEFKGVQVVGENDSTFPNIEAGITLEDIRKVEMPNEKITLKLTLPIDQVEWLKAQKPKALNELFQKLLQEMKE